MNPRPLFPVPASSSFPTLSPPLGSFQLFAPCQSCPSFRLSDLPFGGLRRFLPFFSPSYLAFLPLPDAGWRDRPNYPGQGCQPARIVLFESRRSCSRTFPLFLTPFLLLTLRAPPTSLVGLRLPPSARPGPLGKGRAQTRPCPFFPT